MSATNNKEASATVLVELYRYMQMARTVDSVEEDFTRRGEAFFRVSGAGHEGTVAIWPHLIREDWLHCHYRDKALLLARGLRPERLFAILFAKDASSSHGRRMPGFCSEPGLNILSMTTVVGTNALQAVGVAERIKSDPAGPIVYCSFGDGSTQEGEVLESIGLAAARQLPVLYVVQNNGYAISTETRGRTFFSSPEGQTEKFFDIPLTHINGKDVAAAYQQFGGIVNKMRQDRKPAIVIFDIERLDSHTNADDHTIYRSQEEIDEIRKSADPIANLAKHLVAQGIAKEQLETIDREVEEQARAQALKAQRGMDPLPTFYAKKELPRDLTDPRREYGGDEGEPRLVMGHAIREVLRYHMEKDERVTLFGEDIADPKGDVFGVTRGLTQAFPGRVRNSPLSESTILGFSIGEALAGGRPVAFLQFADFLPLAHNQLFAELGSMYWRTGGRWEVPLILMLTCGAYKPGLGPFHANTMETVGVHTPGVDVFMPSNAPDAAGLLNAAFLSGRPTLFYYPKNLLNDRNTTTSADVDRQIVPIGRARIMEGTDITIVCWGNTVPLCRRAAAALHTEGYSPEVIDLRTLSPWDEEAVIKSVEKTGRLIVTHEDNVSCGFGAEVLARTVEGAKKPFVARRIARPDTYVPFNFANQLEVLPSYKSILTGAVEMLGGRISWEAPRKPEPGTYFIEAIGSSPSDESVTVLDWLIKVGDTIEAGAEVASLEADKAVQELSSPVSGEVLELLAEEGEMVKVGTPIARLKVDKHGVPIRPVSREEPGTPVIIKGR